MAEVELQGVTKVYPNGITALRDLSLRVADGEVVVLLGPSGCGKTTTLRIIAGLEDPTEGTVHIGGMPMTRVPPHGRNVAMIFQRPAVYPHLSVRRNLEFPLKMRRDLGGQGAFPRNRPRPFSTEELRNRVADAARLLALEHVLDRRADRLSGGEQQRVALARAFVRRPAVFLFDEPLSQLDDTLRMELRRQLHLLSERLQTTMIHVTHDQVEAMTLADRLVVLDHGVIQQVGAPDSIYERPRNRFVAAFVGAPRMSFADGCLVADQGVVSFVSMDEALPVPATWAAHAGREVTLGIRPEDVRLGRDAAAGATLEMEVDRVESLGRASAATLRRGEFRVTALLEGGQTVGRGQPVEVTLRMEHAHLFDRATGLALRSPPPDG